MQYIEQQNALDSIVHRCQKIQPLSVPFIVVVTQTRKRPSHIHLFVNLIQHGIVQDLPGYWFRKNSLCMIMAD